MKFIFEVDTTSGTFTITNQETGEIQTVQGEVKEKVKRVRKPKVQESNSPELLLEDNKYFLNTKAREVLEVSERDRVDIRYETIDGKECPVIGSVTAFGNGEGFMLTKQHSVSCRGKYNQILSQYGTKFELTDHPMFRDLFVLTPITESNTEDVTVEDTKVFVEDSNINLPSDASETDISEEEEDKEEVSINEADNVSTVVATDDYDDLQDLDTDSDSDTSDIDEDMLDDIEDTITSNLITNDGVEDLYDDIIDDLYDDDPTDIDNFNFSL